MATVLYGANDTVVQDAIAEDDDLWLSLDDLTRASGWQLKPEGACLSDLCVPIPAGRTDRFLRDAAGARRFNLAELARLQGVPLLHDDASGTWCFGETSDARAQRMSSLDAPDFSLPDLGGKMHSLTDYRGMKIFMVAWASW
jgi:hypothetical protein